MLTSPSRRSRRSIQERIREPNCGPSLEKLSRRFPLPENRPSMPARIRTKVTFSRTVHGLDWFRSETSLLGSESDSMNQYYRARYYDFQSGRFLSEDPLRWAGSSNEFYSYVKSDPISNVDPYGMRITYNGNLSYWANAVSYLHQDAGMAGIIDYLSRMPADVEIIETPNAPCGSPDSARTDRSVISGTFKIYWNPHCAYLCPKGGNANTPACVLGHELAHAALEARIGTLAANKLRNSPAGPYDNLNEMYVITGPENNLAIHLGECVRSSHAIGTSYFVPRPSEK